MSRTFTLSVLAAGLAPVASAGPPGALDDPFAIGTGNIEFIVAASAAEQSGEIGLHGPVFDITMGVTDRLDFLFMGGPPPASGVGCQPYPECDLQDACAF